MPSLKNKLDELALEAYDLSIDEAVKETGLDAEIFPKTCIWTIEQVLDEEFLPS